MTEKEVKRLALTAVGNEKVAEVLRRLAEGPVKSWDVLEMYPDLSTSTEWIWPKLGEAGFVRVESGIEYNPKKQRSTRVRTFYQGPNFGKLYALLRAADDIGGFENVTPVTTGGTMKPVPEGEPVEEV